MIGSANWLSLSLVEQRPMDSTRRTSAEPEMSLSADELTVLEALRAAHQDYSELIRITQIPTAAETDQLMGSYDWSKPIGLVFTSETSAFLV